MSNTQAKPIESSEPGKDALRRALGRPALHLSVGALFLAAFSWPFFTFTHAGSVWTWLYLSWAACIAAAFVFSRGTSQHEIPDEEEDDFEDDDELEAEGASV